MKQLILTLILFTAVQGMAQKKNTDTVLRNTFNLGRLTVSGYTFINYNRPVIIISAKDSTGKRTVHLTKNLIHWVNDSTFYYIEKK